MRWFLRLSNLKAKHNLKSWIIEIKIPPHSLVFAGQDGMLFETKLRNQLSATCPFPEKELLPEKETMGKHVLKRM